MNAQRGAGMKRPDVKKPAQWRASLGSGVQLGYCRSGLQHAVLALGRTLHGMQGSGA